MSGSRESGGGSEEFDKIIGGLEIPDDISGLDDIDTDAPRELSGALMTPRAVLLTPVGQPEAVLALAVLAGIKGIVIADESGATVVLEDTATGAPERAAASLSKMLPGARIVLLLRAGTHISGTQWESGESEGDVAAGLVLSAVSDDVESIVIGSQDPGDHPRAKSTRSMGRFAALRALRRLARDTTEGQG